MRCSVCSCHNWGLHCSCYSASVCASATEKRITILLHSHSFVSLHNSTIHRMLLTALSVLWTIEYCTTTISRTGFCSSLSSALVQLLLLSLNCSHGTNCSQRRRSRWMRSKRRCWWIMTCMRHGLLRCTMFIHQMLGHRRIHSLSTGLWVVVGELHYSNPEQLQFNGSNRKWFCLLVRKWTMDDDSLNYLVQRGSRLAWLWRTIVVVCLISLQN